MLRKIKLFFSTTPDSGTYAIPLDCFRIGVGLLSFIYFLRSLIEAPYFMGRDGLINHELVQKIFWYTWQPLFFPSMTSSTIQIMLAMAMLLSLLLVIGFKTRVIAFILYLIVVCSYRFHFLVFFVDDVVMHLLLFWCFILPTGHTLTFFSWFKNKKIMNEWKKIRVEKLTLKLFLANIALIYFVAGVSKFTSPLWSEGVALLAVLKLPMGWFSNLNLESYKTILKTGNYLALFIEPLLALIIILKPWSKVKIILGMALALFHFFIILTLDIPFANLGCLILVPLLFRQELMDLLNKEKSHTQKIIPNHKWASILASFVVLFLTGAMSCALFQNQWRKARRVTGLQAVAETKSLSADSGGAIQSFFYSGLWITGLAQGYRLLDWIDERNFHQKISITESTDEESKTNRSARLTPIGMRGSLIMTYISGITWMYVDPQFIDELRLDIQARLASMYCRKVEKKTEVEVWQSLTRIDSFQPHYRAAEILLRFRCENFRLLKN